MKANEAIREIMNRTGTRMFVLAHRLGKGTNTVSNRIAREGISVALLNETIRAMDYKIIVAPITAHIPDGGFEVE